MDWTVVIATLLSAAAYGIIFWWKARETSEDPVPFDAYKFTATMIIALIIGLITAFSGQSLTEEYFLIQMGSYAGYVAMVETILKALVSLIGGRWPTSFPKP
jgi:hypothetical protein